MNLFPKYDDLHAGSARFPTQAGADPSGNHNNIISWARGTGSLTLTEAGYTVVSFSGELDLKDRDRIIEALRPLVSAPAPLVDFSEVTYLDSTVLGALIGLNKRVVQHGKRLSIIVREPRILKIFLMTKLNYVFDIFESPEAALRKNVIGIKPGQSGTRNG